MDRLIYIAMTGAQQQFHQQAVTANNLANASTAGYKAETSGFRTAQVVGPGLPARAYALNATQGADLSAGALQRTGAPLDVAIEGDGFFAVQALNGNEAYTRGGSFKISPEGELQTRGGLPVLGEGGPISIPQDSRIAIGADGTISAVDLGQSAANVLIVGRLKLVNPERSDLVRGADGLFRTRSGDPADADPNVKVVGGAVEDSNVNTVSTMVEMINLARQYELHMKILQTADANAQRANQLLSAG
jgi:flagellar basal-body rod protein FlgF